MAKPQNVIKVEVDTTDMRRTVITQLIAMHKSLIEYYTKKWDELEAELELLNEQEDM